MGTSRNQSMPEQRRHTACIEHDGKHCDVCETLWPCPAYTAALDAVRARAADRDRTERDTAIRHALALGVPARDPGPRHQLRRLPRHPHDGLDE